MNTTTAALAFAAALSAALARPTKRNLATLAKADAAFSAARAAEAVAKADAWLATVGNAEAVSL